MVRQREKKVLRAVKAARASRYPNKFTKSNAVSQAWSVCARCVLARAGTAGAADGNVLSRAAAIDDRSESHTIKSVCCAHAPIV
jgi:hypothetical protein